MSLIVFLEFCTFRACDVVLMKINLEAIFLVGQWVSCVQSLSLFREIRPLVILFEVFESVGRSICTFSFQFHFRQYLGITLA